MHGLVSSTISGVAPRVFASIYEPPGADGITLQTVEVNDQRVIVHWHSLDHVAPWPPVNDDDPGEPRFEPISVTDDVGTVYEEAEGHGNHRGGGSRGTYAATPSPPTNATVLTVATSRRSYDFALT